MHLLKISILVMTIAWILRLSRRRAQQLAASTTSVPSQPSRAMRPPPVYQVIEARTAPFPAGASRIGTSLAHNHIPAWQRDPDVRRVVEQVVTEFMASNPTLFECCTDVCKQIRRRLPLRVRQAFSVYVVTGLWDARFASTAFLDQYTASYTGRRVQDIAHEWLAFSDVRETLDDRSVEMHHMLDPTYVQFMSTDAVWSYAACWSVHPGPYTYIGRVMDSRLIDPSV